MKAILITLMYLMVVWLYLYGTFEMDNDCILEIAGGDGITLDIRGDSGHLYFYEDEDIENYEQLFVNRSFTGTMTGCSSWDNTPHIVEFDGTNIIEYDSITISPEAEQ